MPGTYTKVERLSEEVFRGKAEGESWNPARAPGGGQGRAPVPPNARTARSVRLDFSQNRNFAG